MFNDRWTAYAQFRVDFEKVKDDLDVAHLGRQKSFNKIVCIDGVLIQYVDYKIEHEQAFKVLSLQKQLHFETRNCVQA